MSTVESIIPYLSKWYAIILGAVLVYSFTRYLKVRSFMKKHGCEETFALRGGLGIFNFFNLPYLRQMLDAKRNGEVMELFKSVFDDDDVLTCYLRLGGVRVVCTIDPENVKAVLATQFSDFALGTRHAHFKPLLGDGIFTLDGEGWKHSRAMLRPQFARDQVSHVTSLEPHLQTFAKHVRLSKGNTLDLQSLFFKLTVDTATEFLFGESVHSLYDESIGSAALTFDGKQGFADAFNLSQAWLASRSYSQVFYRFVDSRGFRKSCSDVHKFAAYYVDKALNASPEEIEERSKGGYTFLYELVKQTRNRNVLQDQLLNILVAGRDTTAGLLSFTFFELARNPETWAKLKQEIETHFGTGTPEDISNITFETLKKCEYLKLVLNEVLRLYPSVPVNFRVATKDTTIPRGGGKDAQSPVFVGKGTTLAYCVFATQRLESYYGKDANEFRPERWNELSLLGWAYLPFNGGPRICLGQQFALTEASYIVVRLAQMFPNLISKDDRPYPPKKSVHLTMCHQDGVYVEMS